MDEGYNHFSHPHSLFMHQMPEGVEVMCSGCNSSATGNGILYVCWQCNFFLHEQCWWATRSLKHPSHPAHPLTLVPYPTYPSNSFYCNSCEFIGTGFSYACADCQFDLHVQCAYSISSFHCYNPVDNQVPPGWNGQNFNVAHNSYPLPAAHNPYMAPGAHSKEQYHSTGPDIAYHASIPPGHQNSFTTAPQPSSVSLPTGAPYSSMAPQTGPASVSVPISSIAGTQYHSMPGNVSVPSNPATSAQYPSVAPHASSVSVPTKIHDSHMAQTQNMASMSIPAANQPENHVESGQTRLNDKGTFMHFSHPHSLVIVNYEDKEEDVACSGCEESLVGKGYSCVEPECDFNLHESCFLLKKDIQHKSHPEHPLTLLSLAPYNNENGEFTCNACFSDGTGFTYHCCVCKFDLHVHCVSLHETFKRSDHEHVLKLFYSRPTKEQESEFSCNVCHGEVQKDRWAYYCESCDYGTHLGCVDCEECERDSVVDIQGQLQMLQLQMEMSRQQAQMIASMGASLASLV